VLLDRRLVDRQLICDVLNLLTVPICVQELDKLGWCEMPAGPLD